MQAAFSRPLQVTLLEVSGWSGSADQLRSAAAQQLSQLVRSETTRLQGSMIEQKQQQQQQQQQQTYLQEQQPPQWQHPEVATAAGKRQLRLGVLRTSLGPNIPPGLVSGAGLEAWGGVQIQQQQHSAVQDSCEQAIPHLQQQQQGGSNRCLQGSGGESFGVSDARTGVNSSVGLQGAEVVEYMLGDIADPDEVGRQLFLALRMMDTIGVDAIVVEGVREEGAGAAVMNRLRKAATTVVLLQTGDNGGAVVCVCLCVLVKIEVGGHSHDGRKLNT
eukprot:838672-Pelagomonas_calceolata.AAC.2